MRLALCLSKAFHIGTALQLGGQSIAGHESDMIGPNSYGRKVNKLNGHTAVYKHGEIQNPDALPSSCHSAFLAGTPSPNFFVEIVATLPLAHHRHGDWARR